MKYKNWNMMKHCVSVSTRVFIVFVLNALEEAGAEARGVRLWKHAKPQEIVHRSVDNGTHYGDIKLPATTKRRMSATINRTAISASSKTLSLTLFNNESVSAVQEEFTTRQNYSVWNGHLENKAGSSVTFILRSDITYGEIEYINGTGHLVLLELLDSLLIDVEPKVPTNETGDTVNNIATKRSLSSKANDVVKRDAPRTCNFTGYTVNTSGKKYGIADCTKAISWHDALDECQKLSGQLATIPSKIVNDNITSLLEPHRDTSCPLCGAWIGMHLPLSTYLKWIDGTAMNYTNTNFWAIYEPSGNSNKDTSIAVAFQDGKWHDYKSSTKYVKSYLCEQSADSPFPRSCAFKGFTVNADGSKYGIGKCNTSISWTDAVSECRKVFGQLASLHSNDGQREITSLFEPYRNASCPKCAAWIGMDGSFTTYKKWINGSYACYKNWTDNHTPNQTQGETAVGMILEGGKWNTYLPLTPKVKTYVCEQAEGAPRGCSFKGFTVKVDGKKYGAGNCSKPISWALALKECKASFSQLATIKNSAVNEKISTLIEPYKDDACPSCAAWIGMEKKFTSYTKWISGSSVSYSNWGSTAVSTSSTTPIKSAVGMSILNGTWNKYSPSTQKIKSYVCEQPGDAPRSCNFKGFAVSSDGKNYGIGECSKRISWDDAELECRKSFGQLATIHTSSANEKIRNLFPLHWDDACPYCGAWIGLKYTGKHIKKWIDGSDVNFTNWGNEEPSGRKFLGEAVAMMYKSGKWNDHQSLSFIKSFICEEPKDPPRVCNFHGFEVNSDNYNYGIGECNKPIPHASAVHECNKAHGQLATVKNAETNARLQTLFDPYRDPTCSLCAAWIGNTKQNTSNYTQARDGTNVSYRNWAFNEPSSASNGENSIGIVFMNGKWNDYPTLTHHIKTFVCQQIEDPYCRDNGSEISLMVFYSHHTVAEYGSVRSLEAKISAAVEAANQAFRNSRINNTRLLLLPMKQINYTDSGSVVTDLRRLMDSDDGHMDQVHSYRKTNNVDLIMYISAKDNSSCGAGVLVDKVQSYLPYRGFSVTNGDSRFTCLTGYQSLAHQIGHNMGLNHNPNKFVSHSPIKPFAFANNECDVSGGEQRTIMSYPCNSRTTTRVRMFSTPHAYYPGTTRLAGTAMQNNAEVIRRAIRKVSHYRCADPVPMCGGVIMHDSCFRFASPDYSQITDARRECVWTIVAGGYGRLKLQFTTHTLEESENCTKGHVEVRDGVSPTSTLIKKFCGTSNPGDIYSTETRMYIRFVSKSLSNSTRIKALYLRQLYKNQCPLTTGGEGICAHVCRQDSECSSGERCCPSNCWGYKCMTKTNDTY